MTNEMTAFVIGSNITHCCNGLTFASVHSKVLDLLTKGLNMLHVRSYPKLVEFQGLTKRAVVTIEYDLDDLDFEFWDKGLAKSTQKQIDSGKSLGVYIQVRIEFSDLAGFVGYDSIGQVVVSAINAQNEVMDTVKEYEMVAKAELDLCMSVVQGRERLEKFFDNSPVSALDSETSGLDPMAESILNLVRETYRGS